MPDEECAAIDVAQLARIRLDRRLEEPGRFWMMDALTTDMVGEPRKLGGE